MATSAHVPDREPSAALGPSDLGVVQLSFWFEHADAFCRVALETPGVRLVGCWDSDVRRGRAKAKALGLRFFSNLEDAIHRDDVQAVSICAEPFRNPSLVEACARAGKHVLVEKPMAVDIDGARRIVRAAERYGIQVMPAFNLRFSPGADYVHELVRSGRLGTVIRARLLHGDWTGPARAGWQAAGLKRAVGWKRGSDPTLLRRCSLYWRGSHAALWYVWMFGLPKRVRCSRTTIIKGLPVEDNSVAVFEYPSGMLGVMECSETLVAQGAVAEIYGTAGAAFLLRGNLPSTRVNSPSYMGVAVFDHARSTWEYPPVDGHFIRHEGAFTSAGQFLSAIREGRSVPMNVYHGYESIVLLDASERSALSGHVIRLMRRGRRVWSSLRQT